MAIVGSFVDGVFRGMRARDTMDNNKRVRKMEDTRFEREGEKHGWDRERHDIAMKRANKALARGNGYSRSGTIRDTMSDYGAAPTQSGNGAPATSGASLSALDAIPRSQAPMSYGNSVEMSALPAAGLPQQPVRLAYDPQRGLIPENTA